MLMLIAGLASCAQSDELKTLSTQNKLVTVAFEASEVTMTPITRAADAHMLRFVMEVWSVAQTGGSNALVHRIEQPAADGAKGTTFTFELENQGDYQLLFWADYLPKDASADENGKYPDKYYLTNEKGGADTYKGLTAVKLNPSVHALNNEQRDAFYSAYSFQKTEQEMVLPKQILKRAVGKLVIKEKDKAVYQNSKSLSVSYAVPNTFNVATGNASGTYSMSHTDLSLAGDDSADDLTLFYDYIFTTAGDGGYAMPEFIIKGKNKGNQAEHQKTIPANVPIKQNKRTVLSGTNMLVAPAAPGSNVTVETEIHDKWEDDVVVDGDQTLPESAEFVGEGTVDAPYEIGTGEHLKKLMDLVKAGETFGELPYADAVYKQVADITTGTVKIAIGTAEKPFKGSYDGDAKKIEGLICTFDGTAYTALFAVVDGARLSNIRVTGLKNLTKNGALAVGGICALSRGTTTISNTLCEINNISGGGTHAGVICGTVESGTLTLDACKTVGTTTPTYTYKTVDGNSNNIGGLIGYVASGAGAVVTDCANMLKMTQGALAQTGNFYMGGICGKTDGTLTITRSYNTGVFARVKDLATVENTLVGALCGNPEFDASVDCFYAAAGGAAVRPTHANGSQMMKADVWPAWDLDATAWKSLGAFDATSPAYPTLDWE